MQYPIVPLDTTGEPAKDFVAGRWYRCVHSGTRAFTKDRLYLAAKACGTITRLVDNDGHLIIPDLSEFVRAD